ncbi:glycosyl hydrolase [Pseudoxanthomonas jiangsuensis]|uniref:glycoside hydrolase family 127 protein n=1 Tax=Pseudoxanthomonas jiangsuensis TaxID=619688 RepID=UPI00139138E8|nr:glycoside hydrolase family 127 protein [Pseudoxanthomonas jiangsuensis]KAF1698368.1 glycosyl hydrolase [Pseudoxanthomonas jiangsuensis]
MRPHGRDVDGDRRRLVAALVPAALLPLAPLSLARAVATPVARGPLQFAPLADVHLSSGPFAHASALNLRYLAALDMDRLLAPCRREAGLPSPAPAYPNWESMGLDGHTAGHYLSALAQQAAQGDTRMRDRLDYMVAAIAECQRAHGDGYAGGVPGGRKLWARIAAGDFTAESFSLEGAWVPFYNLHKTFAGLRDAWWLAGHRQAREALVGFADWVERLVANLDDRRLQRVLDTEHGGMNEVLADVYAITGERRYLALARRFSHRALLDPLLRREDALDGLHANTQIPKVIGFARIGELDGDEAWIDAARFFWERVALHRSIAFGGNSVREHFNPAADFAPMVQSREGPETCNSYNMLKLTLLLERLRPDPRHADFYERTLFNHVLSSQHPGHGGLVYFTPIRPRHYRVYSQPQECFWCCVGSGLENHGRHAAFAYSRGDGVLRVNLYMDSQLDWAERGLQLRQRTAFPEEPRTALRLSLQRAQSFALELRHPHWLHGPLRVKVNGRPWPLHSTPSSYARIERRWRNGDRVEVELPMHTRIEALPDGSEWVAAMHGPLLLAARTGDEGIDGLIADAGRGSHIAPGAYLPLDAAPMLVGDRDALAGGITPLPARPLAFGADALVQPATFRGLRLEPLYRIHDARYMAYWRTTTAAGYPAVVASIEAAERERQALDARTLDQVQPGEQQPEVEHGYEGQDSSTGMLLGRRWRDAGRAFSYRLRAPHGHAGGVPLALRLGLFGGDWQVAMDVEVDGLVVGTVQLDGSGTDDFLAREIALPDALARTARARDGIQVRMRARDGRRTARLFELRLVEQPPVTPE